MPVVAVEAVELDIRYDDPLTVQRLPFEPQAERLAHDAVAAVAADEESSLNVLDSSIGVCERGPDDIRALVK
jgi:hypothetical protein